MGDDHDRGVPLQDGVNEQEDEVYYDSDNDDGDDFSYGDTPLELIAPKYYNWREYFPFLQKMIDMHDVLLQEMRTFTERRWTPWPEQNLYARADQNGDWTVVPFLHTFPAYDESKMSWVEPNTAVCPKTTELLKSIPGIRTALYSRLGPDTVLSSHKGWADLANHVLRVHFTLVCPPEPKSCGLWVEREVRYHATKKLLVFDDSKLHKAFNTSLTEERIVLIFDIVRPESIPLGLATGGHTDQLDMFIEQYHRSIGVTD